MDSNLNNTQTIKAIKKRRKLKLWVWILLLTICCTILFISLIEIFFWQKDNNKTGKIINEVINDTEVMEVYDSENTENVNPPEDYDNDYWYYITFPLINVDFTQLLEKNSDTVAWINMENTNINYPVVQTNNNDYYLTHSYDNNYNEAGWVFLDYRNSADLSDRNSIIYAHSRLNKTMFGSLSKVLSESWFSNKDNHIIRLSTPYENTLWQIFSVYIIPTENYYITTSFTDATFSQYLSIVTNRSKFNFNTNVSINDKLLTLSTCYSDSERTVVHAKLIKRETRN